MDARIVNPFLLAAIDVLRSFAKLDAQASKPFLKKDSTAIGDVSSIVGFTGYENGTFSISFKADCVLQIASNLFGEQITALDNDAAEAIGEIANMISGQARRVLDDRGFHFDGGIPTVAMGEGHCLHHIGDGPIIGVPFSTDAGDFVMELCFES